MRYGIPMPVETRNKAVEGAVMVGVNHDTAARALSPKIRKYVQAQSWFQDLALLEV